MVTAAPIRLAIFTDTYTPQVNGVARTLERLVSAIRERGGDVMTFTTTDPEAVEEAGVSRYESVPFWMYPHLRMSLPRLSCVTRELAAFAPNLVHAATPFGVGLMGRAAARRLRTPFITSYHTSFSAYAKYYGLGVLSNVGWSFLRRFHNSGLRTYAPSFAIREDLTVRGFDNVVVWDRGVDLGTFHPSFRNEALRTALGADEDTVLVGYVGRLSREKDLDTLLEAIPIVADRTNRRVRFVFVGDGPYEAACRARELPETTFLGRHIGRSLSELYASMDVFVFPSTTDTFGNVLLEAAASRLAIVAADAGPTPEIMGSAAALVHAKDPLACADAILRLVHDDDARNRLGNAAFALARAKSWTSVFDTLVHDYCGLIDRYAQPVRVPA